MLDVLLQAATSIYTDAVQQLGSEKMFSLYAAFLHELLQQSDAARTAGIAEGSLESPDNAAVAALLCDVYQQAADKGKNVSPPPSLSSCPAPRKCSVCASMPFLVQEASRLHCNHVVLGFSGAEGGSTAG